MTWLLILLAIVVVLFGVGPVRRRCISAPALRFFRRIQPPLSQTEREALDAGTVWWEAELFRGSPDWNRLHSFPPNRLTKEERHFIDNQVNTLLSMLNDYDIVHHRKGLPDEVWDYIRKERFLSLIIPKEYGGLEFSAEANSAIVGRIAARSMGAAISVMVPNSLGPGELLTHYGTDEQKQYWLPRLADGTDIPCFALTGPTAGSDAGSIPDAGIVCRGEYQGEQVLGIRLTWDKRYITLAPIATVLGLAFKLRDPDGLLGDVTDIGITCALIPTSHPGVEIGQRHNPLGLGFMNGTTRGDDVFIPMDWLIGGPKYAGKGWKMLVECLSAGRGISLPSLATASGHLATRTTSAYSRVRQQFGVSLSEFEGIQEALARIAARTYVLEATRQLTLTAIDSKQKPSVVTAIAKYHLTEIARKVVNDAMDVHGGKGIQLGPKNYLGHNYVSLPIAITVEGANILTRNLMIFGQGAVRCHPYLLAELDAMERTDKKQSLQRFDSLLLSHLLYASRNAVMSLVHALTGSRLAKRPVSGSVGRYYQQLERLSCHLAIVSDIALLVLGGSLKRREMISARLGDVLSQLYLASAVLRLYEQNGRQSQELPLVRYALDECLAEASKALNSALDNFPHRLAAWLCRLLTFPLGNHFKTPKDELAKRVANAICHPGSMRDRLTHLCPMIDELDDGVTEVEHAYIALHQVEPQLTKIKSAQQSGALEKGVLTPALLSLAVEQGVIDLSQYDTVLNAMKLARVAIDVDEFASL